LEIEKEAEDVEISGAAALQHAKLINFTNYI
jgi:hypothetical protein